MNGSAASGRLVRWLPAALIAAGVVLRLLWALLPSSDKLSFGEAANVAIAFARTGAFADAFVAGQGPTAHIMPVPPMIAGLVYRAFGIQTPLSEGVLIAWSLLLVFGAYWLLFKAFEAAGAPLAGRLGALAVLCLLPLNFNLEVVWFRTWDGGLAVVLAAAFLLAVLRLDAAERVGNGPLAALALLAAAVLAVSPPLGLGAYAGGLLLFARRLPWRRWPAGVAIVGVATVLVLAPWTIRNAQVMGKPIVFRDNFGLELAMGYFPGALEAASPRDAFKTRHDTIHPYANPAGFAAMQAAGGEVAYFDALGTATKAWIAAHPGDAVRLTLRHLTEFLFPPAWYWNQFSDAGSTGTTAKLAANWLITLLGLAGLGYAVLRLEHRYRYLALMTLLPILPYLVVQPTLRYRYIVLGLLVFFAGDAVARFSMRWQRRTGTS